MGGGSARMMEDKEGETPSLRWLGQFLCSRCAWEAHDEDRKDEARRVSRAIELVRTRATGGITPVDQTLRGLAYVNAAVKEAKVWKHNRGIVGREQVEKVALDPVDGNLRIAAARQMATTRAPNTVFMYTQRVNGLTLDSASRRSGWLMSVDAGGATKRELKTNPQRVHVLTTEGEHLVSSVAPNRFGNYHTDSVFKKSNSTHWLPVPGEADATVVGFCRETWGYPTP